jgi:flagellar protein FlgJ
MPTIQPMAACEIAQSVAGKSVDRSADLKKACADFESTIAYYAFKTMRATVPDGGLFKKEDMFSTLMDQKLAEQLSQKGEGLGLQNAIYRQLSRDGEK